MTDTALTSERAVIGAMLLDERCVDNVMAIASADDLVSERNRAIFKSISYLRDVGSPVDAVTVLSEARKHTGEDLSDYVLEIMRFTPTAANAEEYAEIVAKEAMARRLEQMLTDCRSDLYGGADARAVCAELQGKIGDIAKKQSMTGAISSCDAMVGFMEYRESLKNGAVQPAVKTGYSRVDELLGGGMVAEGLYILAARPGIGKTTLALNIAKQTSRRVPTLFVSLEMSDRQISAKRLALETSIPAWRLMNDAALSQAEEASIYKHASALSEQKITFNRWSGATVSDIGFLARQVEDLGLVIIDYLGLIQTKEGRSLYEKTTYISGALKRLARSLGVPILALAQLNREVESGGRKPRLSDLRDSGAIEQDADGVMFLHCPSGRPKSEDGSTPVLMELLLEKNRHASIGEVDMSFYLSSGRIVQSRSSHG